MNFQPLLRGASLALSTLAFSAATWAQAPFSSLKLEFTEPTGTVSTTASIPVYLKLTNTDSVQDFVFASSLPLAGLNAADIPTSAWSYDPVTGGGTSINFASYTSFHLGTGFGCSGNFTSVCDAGVYTFSWPSTPVFSDPFKLAAGQSFTYLFGSFVPTNGAAPEGTYEFYHSTLWLDVNGVDAGGNAISTIAFPTGTCYEVSASACNALGQSFFTRTVVAAAVPEPASVLMLSLGLTGLIALRRRRH